jgi:DNA-binding XRE family transcriptional regulator
MCALRLSQHRHRHGDDAQQPPRGAIRGLVGLATGALPLGHLLNAAHHPALHQYVIGRRLCRGTHAVTPVPWCFRHGIKIITAMPASAPPPTAATVLAERIRTGRTRCGLTQEQLAHQADTTTRTIQRLEGAEITSPRLQPLLRIAQVLNLDSGELLAGLKPGGTT